MDTNNIDVDIDKVNHILKSFEGREGALIQILHRIQEEFGFLPENALSLLSERTGIPLAQVYGVASFYKYFYFTPRGKNIIKVCVGTACHVRGAGPILSELEKVLGIKNGETTRDLSFSLETVGCVGCCALAPVVVVNEEVKGAMKPDKVKGMIEEVREKDEAS